MKIETKNIDFSKSDILRGINLPKELTPELAELMAVIVGDGHIYFNNESREKVTYSIWISGNLSEDYEYYSKHINKILLRNFNLSFKLSSQRKNELIVRVHSKAITNFFKNLGIKSGRKVDNNEIPEVILNSNDEIKKSFLKGMFDTEFSIMFKKDYRGKHSKPVIATKMKSSKISNQLKELLEYFGFRVRVYQSNYFDKRSKKIIEGYKVEMAGKKTLKRYLELIGFENFRHATKIKIWKKFGFCPPKLSYQQRLNILNGKLDPNNFYN